MKKWLFLCTLFALSSLNAQAVELPFNWGVSKAIVKEISEKNGNTAELRYRIDLSKSGEKYLLSYSDFEFVSLNGEPLSQELREAFKARNFEQAFPRIIVNSKGEPEEIVDFENFIKNAGVLISKKEEFTKFAQNSEVAKALYIKAFEVWCVWSCNWANQSLLVNKPKVEFSEIDLLGMKLPQKTTLTYFENQADPKLGRLLFTSEISNSGDNLSGLSNVINNVNKSFNKPELRTDELKNTKVNKKTTVDATIELSTLRPMDVAFITEISVSEAASQPKTKLEKRRYQFEWLK